MGDKQGSRMVFPVNELYQAQDFMLSLLVYGSCGLIEKEYLRLLD
jgi:hypothetical protein